MTQNDTLSKHRFPPLRRAAYAILVTVLVLFQARMTVVLFGLENRMKSKEPAIPEWEKATLYSPELFKITSFGQLPIAIDFQWLASLQDPILSPHQEWAPGTHPAVFYSFNMTSLLDPRFFDAYMTGASFLSVVRNDSVGAGEILARGNEFRKTELPKYSKEFRQRFWPYEWSIPTTLIYTYLFPLRDLIKAAQVIREAAATPGSPDYVHGMERRLERPGGIYDIGFLLMDTLFKFEKNPEIRQELQKKRTSLYVLKFLATTNEQFRIFRKTLKEAPITKEQMEAAFRDFLRKNRGSAQDPFGGRLSVDSQGKISTSTAYTPVYGLTGD